MRILQEEEGVEDEVGFMLEESIEDLYWANAHRQQYRGVPTELDNSFEALAEDSDGEEADNHGDDNEADASTNRDDTNDEPDQPHVSIWDLPVPSSLRSPCNPCCHWKCED